MNHKNISKKNILKIEDGKDAGSIEVVSDDDNEEFISIEGIYFKK